MLVWPGSLLDLVQESVLGHEKTAEKKVMVGIVPCRSESTNCLVDISIEVCHKGLTDHVVCVDSEVRTDLKSGVEHGGGSARARGEKEKKGFEKEWG